jgi:glucokinase
VATGACLGVAGPVEGHQCRATNLPWVVDARDLGRRTGIERFALVNDFVAMANSVPELRADDLAVFGGTPGGRRAHQPIAVVGPGTGLGVGFLFWPEGGSRYEVIPSEGGHADFAPRSPLEAALMRFLALKYGRVSAERVLCGRGLVDIFQFLSEEDSLRRQVRAETRQELARAEDPAVVVTQRALDDSDPICEIAVSLFGSVLGAVAGNLALTLLARGGVFVGGGIAPRIVEVLDQTGMREAFENKGRFSSLLADIPLSVIVHPNPGLLGAAAWAARV